jgi:hypothetical protein
MYVVDGWFYAGEIIDVSTADFVDASSVHCS